MFWNTERVRDCTKLLSLVRHRLKLTEICAVRGNNDDNVLFCFFPLNECTVKTKQNMKDKTEEHSRTVCS